MWDHIDSAKRDLLGPKTRFRVRGCRHFLWPLYERFQKQGSPFASLASCSHAMQTPTKGPLVFGNLHTEMGCDGLRSSLVRFCYQCFSVDECDRGQQIRPTRFRLQTGNPKRVVPEIRVSCRYPQYYVP